MNEALTPLDRLCVILISLTNRLIGAIGHVPTGTTPPSPATCLCAWLQRLVLRLNRLPSLRPRSHATQAHRPTAPNPPPIAAIRMPQRGGWLIAVSHDFADHADDLHRLLKHSILPTICAEHPAIARSLRRLLVLLDIPCPPALRPPTRRLPTRRLSTLGPTTLGGPPPTPPPRPAPHPRPTPQFPPAHRLIRATPTG